MVWISPSPRPHMETYPGDLLSKIPLAVSPCWLLIPDALGSQNVAVRAPWCCPVSTRDFFTSQGNRVGLPRQIKPSL